MDWICEHWPIFGHRSCHRRVICRFVPLTSCEIAETDFLAAIRRPFTQIFNFRVNHQPPRTRRLVLSTVETESNREP